MLLSLLRVNAKLHEVPDGAHAAHGLPTLGRERLCDQRVDTPHEGIRPPAPRVVRAHPGERSLDGRRRGAREAGACASAPVVSALHEPCTTSLFAAGAGAATSRGASFDLPTVKLRPPEALSMWTLPVWSLTGMEAR